jgi:uncharacterized protein YcfJ
MKNFFIDLTTFTTMGISLKRTILVVFGLFATSGSVMSSDFFVYPNKGQSTDKLNYDKFECHEWAKQQTGIDPNRVATDVNPKRVEKRGGTLRGAARGGLVGVIGGAIGGNAGKGAAIGAGVGALGGTMRRKKSEREQMDAYEEANYQRKALMETFDRAYRACLEGRDYTVK